MYIVTHELLLFVLKDLSEAIRVEVDKTLVTRLISIKDEIQQLINEAKEKELKRS